MLSARSWSTIRWRWKKSMTPCVIFGIRLIKAQVCRPHASRCPPPYITKPQISTGSKLVPTMKGVLQRGLTITEYFYWLLLPLNGAKMVVAGCHDQGPSGNGHAGTLFCRSEDAGFHHYSTGSCRFVWAKLWNSRARWTNQRPWHWEHWCSCRKSGRVGHFVSLLWYIILHIYAYAQNYQWAQEPG